MSPKSVIILHTDQQRYDSLGCNGNAYAHTPHIDRLAAEGTNFTRHISANPVCMPSRASLMTGLYPPGHNVWSNGVALNRKEYAKVNLSPDWPEIDVVPEPPTLADMFAQAGYDTVSFGKLHLTPNLAPAVHGYPESLEVWRDGVLDEWHGPYYGFRYVDLTQGHGEQPCHVGHYSLWLAREHPELYQKLVEQNSKTRPFPAIKNLYPSNLPAELHHSNWLAGRLCEYLAHKRPSDQPFFAFVGFPDPHHPFTPCFDTISKLADVDVRQPLDLNGEGVKTHPILSQSKHDISHLGAEERQTILRYTYAMIHQIDLAVGRITHTLQEMKLWDDTIIVFTSDHGDFLCDHGLLSKNTVGSDALLHIPFILRAPGADLPAQIDKPMSNCDVMPTLAALTGIDPPEWQHGQDMGSIVRNDEEHYALAYCASGSPERANYTVYDATHRLTLYPNAGYVELFDHGRDPGECMNLAQDSRYQQTVEHLMHILGERTLNYINPILGRTSLW
jgi:arylsulfatase A-like enzyme